MKKKRQSKKIDILFILISSFIVVVAWIAFNIYHIYITSTISQTIQAQLIPISPLFDPTTIKQLKTREDIAPIFDIQTNVQTNASQAATTPTPASYSAQVTPTASTSAISRQGQ